MMSFTSNQPRVPAVEAVISQVSEIPVLPQVVYRLVELASSSSIGLDEVESLILTDPGFSAKLLVLANGSHFGGDVPTNSIAEATHRLGINTIRQLAMTVTAFDMFVGKADASSLRRREWWRHSVDTAICAQTIADHAGTDPGEAYTCGLLHDIGKPLLEKYGDGEYAQVEALAAQGTVKTQAEQEVFGCNHCQVGAAIAEALRLPQAIVQSIQYHHIPPEGGIPEYVAVTAIANDCAHLLFTGRTFGEEVHFTNWAVAKLGLSDGALNEIFTAAKAAVSNAMQRAA